MATGSGYTEDIVCQPCQLDGTLEEVRGMCTDCQEYLCQKCFDVHTIPTQMKKHKLLTKDKMIKPAGPFRRKDQCTELCTSHEEEIIKYFCSHHGQLSCSVCITLEHRTCKGILYIPEIAQDLTNNEELSQAERQFQSLVDRSNKLHEDNKEKVKSLEGGCSSTVKIIQEFRQEINQVLDRIETSFVEKCETRKSEELEKLARIAENLKTIHEEIQNSMSTTNLLKASKQNCKLYIGMVKMKNKLKAMEYVITDAEQRHSTSITQLIEFVPNRDIIDFLDHPEAFGRMPWLQCGKSEGQCQLPVSFIKDESESNVTGDVSRIEVKEDATGQGMRTIKEHQESYFGNMEPHIDETAEARIREDEADSDKRGGLEINASDEVVEADEPQMRKDIEDIVMTEKLGIAVNKDESWIVLKREDIGSISKQNKPRATIVKEKNLTMRNVKYCHGIRVKAKNDLRACYVTGMVVLPNSKLIITDYRHYFWSCGNANVKLVDAKDARLIERLTLASSPADVAMINDDRVAVTLPYVKKVVLIRVKASTFSFDTTLSVNGTCYGIDYRNGKLAVSFCNSNKVQVLNLQGIVLYTVETDKRGYALFSQPYYVAFGQDDASLYVSNNGDHSVLCVKFDGALVGKYVDSELRNPRALFSDSKGDVYVCGEGSNNVHRITSDCDKVQVLLTKKNGLTMPCSIGQSDTENTLFVGMWNSSAVKVYREHKGNTCT